MAITVKVKGKHLEVTDGLREHAEQRMAKLEKYVGQPLTATVVESVEGGAEHRVEVTLEGSDGLLLRGEERTSDMYASLDRVVAKLEQRLKKYKGKHTHLRNHQDSLKTLAATNGANVDGLLAADTPLDVDNSPRVVRTKAVTMKPMSIDDAMEMLELVDHDWYVYLDMDTHQTQVVYRRRDGNYGLVIPKI